MPINIKLLNLITFLCPRRYLSMHQWALIVKLTDIYTTFDCRLTID